MTRIEPFASRCGFHRRKPKVFAALQAIVTVFEQLPMLLASDLVNGFVGHLHDVESIVDNLILSQ